MKETANTLLKLVLLLSFWAVVFDGFAYIWDVFPSKNPGCIPGQVTQACPSGIYGQIFYTAFFASVVSGFMLVVNNYQKIVDWVSSQ